MPSTRSVLALAPEVTLLAVLVPELHGAALEFGLGLGMEGWVERATGPLGLVIIFVYSFLIAVAPAGVSEIVLLAPIAIGLPAWLELAIIIAVSGAGKAFGSVCALYVGNEARDSGLTDRFMEWLPLDVKEYSERAIVTLANRYGYIGLALALSVPTFPDTFSIYAFTVLEEDYVKFSAATFVGSVNRLLVTLLFLEGAEEVAALSV